MQVSLALQDVESSASATLASWCRFIGLSSTAYAMTFVRELMLLYIIRWLHRTEATVHRQ